MKRSEIVEKSKKELNDFLATLKPKKYEDGWPEDCWEKEMEKHPMFMSKEVDEGSEMPPLIEALQQLKYDPEMNTPEELAESHKKAGNERFKMQKYRFAVLCYTDGLEVNCSDKELNAQLYNNRASAHFHIGNYRLSMNDAIEAKKLKPDYIKALLTGAKCCFKLKEFLDCVSWCEEGLKVEPGNKRFIDFKENAIKSKETAEIDARKALLRAEKKKTYLELVLDAIHERGITLVGDQLGEVDSMHPAYADAQVRFHGNQLVWPIIFMYPEYGTTDYVEMFNEDSSFMYHFELMFCADDPPAWDKEGKYLAKDLQVYFVYQDSLIPFNKDRTLKEALCDPRYRVQGGVPCFIVTVRGTEFDKSYREKNGCPPE